jgi:hypothetical protein
MIFQECDLGSPLNAKHALIIPPLIVALRPQTKQYHQALALFYQQSYIYIPPYATSAFEKQFEKVKPLVKKIAISIKSVFSFAWNHEYRTVLRKDDAVYFFPNPESLKKLLDGASVTHVHMSLHLVNEDHPPNDTRANFLYDFPNWLAGFCHLKHLEVSIPPTPGYQISQQQDKYNELIGIRGDLSTPYPSGTELFRSSVLTWVAEPGEITDRSEVARDTQGASLEES